MKGMMATLLTLTLAGFANGQQSQFDRDSSRSQFSDLNYDSPLGMLANPFNKEKVDFLRKNGEISWTIDERDSNKIGQIVFGFEDPIDQFGKSPNQTVTTSIKPIAKQGDTIVFEFSETDLKAIKNGALKYELDPREVGQYRNVVVQMRGVTPRTPGDRLASSQTNTGIDNFGTERSGQTFQSDRESNQSREFNRNDSFNRDSEFKRSFDPIADPSRNLMTGTGNQLQDFRSFDSTRQSQPAAGWSDLDRIKDNHRSGIGKNWGGSGNTSGLDRSSQTRNDTSGLTRDLYLDKRGTDYGFANSTIGNGFQDPVPGSRGTRWNDPNYRDGVDERSGNRSSLANGIRNEYSHDRFADASGVGGTGSANRGDAPLTYEERVQREIAQRELNARDDRIERLIQQNDVLTNQLLQVQNQMHDKLDSRLAQNDIPGRGFNQTPRLTSNDPGGIRQFQSQIPGSGAGLNGTAANSPLYILLLCSLGLNAYLGWISRNFYVRYSELADELRETFSASIS